MPRGFRPGAFFLKDSMKHPLLNRQTACITASLLVVLAAPSALANTGTVTINGAVTATTCPTVLINGAVGATVTMPTVSAALLATLGNTAGETPFTIGVSGCTVSGSTKMDIYFTPSSFNAGGRVPKTTGTSTNVDVELLRSDRSTVIAGNLAYGSQYTGQTAGTSAITFAANAATQTFWARYKSTGAVTPGTFVGSFSFTVVYY